MAVKTISVIGGDLRQLTLAHLLEDGGYEVKLYGWKEDMRSGFSKCDPLVLTDAVIFPMPMCVGENINAPFAEKKIEINEILDNLSQDTVVLGGKIPDFVKKILIEQNIIFSDYLEREETAIKNAVATAEGAIEIAMHETPVTIHSSKCLITGYGRIGKVLAGMLKGIGARVCIAARRPEIRAQAEVDGFESVDMSKLSEKCMGQDVIFNTVPVILFDDKILEKIGDSSLIIDLASKPGGVDFENAKRQKVRVIWALSLPGKVAPVTSGRIIFESVLNIFEELGV